MNNPPTPVWDGELWHHPKLPVRFLEPNCERISRVQGDKFDRLVLSIQIHGLANPLVTVSELPEPNFDDWQQFRYRFLWTIPAPVKIVVGHNRYAAIKALSWKTVPVIHCGPRPTAAQKLRGWRRLLTVDDAQRLIRDGRLGRGPFSLTMVEYTPPLKGVPEGFEPLGNSQTADAKSAS